MTLLRVLAFVIVTAVTVSPAFAPAYIKFDGIDGESAHKGHEKWIEVASLADLPAPPAPSMREAGSGLATGRRTYKPISFTKSVDRSSPKLAAARTGKTVFATLVLSHDGKTYTLTNARITDIKTAANRETISLSFDDITVTDDVGAPSTRASSNGPSQQAQAAEPASRQKPTQEPANSGPP